MGVYVGPSIHVKTLELGSMILVGSDQSLDEGTHVSSRSQFEMFNLSGEKLPTENKSDFQVR